jgi:hypothetical protein
MAYDVSTYKSVLDNYLTSGVKYLRYVRKSIGKAIIYYPIINDAQIKSCLTDQIYKDGTKTYYDNSKPYSEWEWFKSNYEIQGLNELDTEVRADYLILIVGKMAALVKLTSDNYETDRLRNSKVYDIQAYLLLNASKRIVRSGNFFYKYSYNHGRFEYGNERLPFEQVVKIANDKNYTSDGIFIDYILQVFVDTVDDLLHILLCRYIRGCKGTVETISKNTWLIHTIATFELLKCDTPYQEAVIGKVISFCTKQMQSAKPPSNIITSHYSQIKGTVKIDKLYDCLSSEGYIDGQTTKADFVFFFSGMGHYPSKKIKWKGKKVLLAILIGKLHTGASTDWKTTEAIFEDVKGENLKKQYNNSKSDSKSEIIIDQLILRAR